MARSSVGFERTSVSSFARSSLLSSKPRKWTTLLTTAPNANPAPCAIAVAEINSEGESIPRTATYSTANHTGRSSMPGMGIMPKARGAPFTKDRIK